MSVTGCTQFNRNGVWQICFCVCVWLCARRVQNCHHVWKIEQFTCLACMRASTLMMFDDGVACRPIVSNSMALLQSTLRVSTPNSPENTHMRSYTYDVLEMVMWTWTQTNICTLPDDLFMVCSRVKSADDEYIFYACHACTQHQQFIQKRLAKHRSKKRKKKRICGFHWILKMFVSIQFTDDRLVSCRCRTFAPLPLWKGDHFFFVYPYKWHCSLATRRHFF